MTQEQADFQIPGFTQYWHSADKRGYSGTAVFTRTAAKKVTYGINGLYTDEGRVITLEYDDFFIINCYAPHSQRNLNHLEFKGQFLSALVEYIKELIMIKAVIVCGDMNVAHKEIDLKNFKSNTENAGFTVEERTAFGKLLEVGLIDSYRYQHPTQSGSYTWWSYRKGVRERNIGWRIDYILIAQTLENRLISSAILPEVLGSDHCPISIEIEL